MEPFRYAQVMYQEVFRPWYAIASPMDGGRQLVIPDIHGCAKTFKALVEKVGFTRKDQLFLLGDYINRGPDSLGVVDFILTLLARGYQVMPLRGNHEELLLASTSKPKKAAPRVVRLHKHRGFTDKDGLLLPAYQLFFRQLPYYYELNSYFLVHGGFDWASPTPLKSYTRMPWVKPFHANPHQVGGRQIIVGHEPTMRPIIGQELARNATVIHLDNGCVYSNRRLMGQLLCLDLQDKSITVQPNIEMKTFV